jgi:hypothetical protein
MPIYQTKFEGQSVGIYTAQRPSIAACKTFSTLRRRNPHMSEARIAVVTEGHRKIEHNYNVTYKNETDSFLGNITRPVAEEIKGDFMAEETKQDLKANKQANSDKKGNIQAFNGDIEAPEQKIM